MKLRLTDEDRKTLGVAEEWLEFDANRTTVREAMRLESIGYQTPAHWRRALAGHEVEVDGEKLVDTEGKPMRRADYAAMAALVWLALARHGIKMEFEDVDFDLLGTTIVADEDEGKEPASDS